MLDVCSVTMKHDFELTTVEYLIGNLHPEEQQLFEEKLAHLDQVKATKEEWDLILSALLRLEFGNEGAIRVPSHLWARIIEEISPKPLRNTRALFSQRRPRFLGGVWQRWSFGFASGVAVACAVAAFSGALDLTRPLTSHQADLIISNTLAGNARLLNTPWSAMQIEAGPIRIEPNASLELWVIPSGEQPISIGLLSEGSQVIWLRSSIDQPEEMTLAISKEPLGGSPNGLPTGPVLTSARFTER